MDSSAEVERENSSVPEKEPVLSGPVLVTIFMTIATVLLIVLLAYWASMVEEEKGWQTPRAGVATSSNKDGDYVFPIIDIDTEVRISWVNYRLLDTQGKTVEKGTLIDIYELDMNVTRTNISFCDGDRDGQLSSGDYFIIRSSANGGLAGNGFTFRLIFTATDDTIVQKELSSNGGYTNRSPRLEWTVANIDQENISLDEDQSAVSHVVPIENTEVKFLLDFNYTGDETRDLIVVLKKDGDLLVEKEVSAGTNDSVSFSETVKVEDVVLVHENRPANYGEFEILVVDTQTNESLLAVTLQLEAWPAMSRDAPSFSTTPLLALVAAACVLLASIRRTRRPSRTEVG